MFLYLELMACGILHWDMKKDNAIFFRIKLKPDSWNMKISWFSIYEFKVSTLPVSFQAQDSSEKMNELTIEIPDCDVFFKRDVVFRLIISHKLNICQTEGTEIYKLKKDDEDSLNSILVDKNLICFLLEALLIYKGKVCICDPKFPSSTNYINRFLKREVKTIRNKKPPLKRQMSYNSSVEGSIFRKDFLTYIKIIITYMNLTTSKNLTNSDLCDLFNALLDKDNVNLKISKLQYSRFFKSLNRELFRITSDSFKVQRVLFDIFGIEDIHERFTTCFNCSLV